MPELPEVQTTVNGLSKVLPRLVIKDTWTDWPKMIKGHNEREFRKKIVGLKVKRVRRRAKNILIDLSGNKTLLLHMKMTGHLLFGKYKKSLKLKAESLKLYEWVPDESEKNEALRDPYNRFIHFVIAFSNRKHLAFSDMRKFAKVALLDTALLEKTLHLAHVGPEPLEETFNLKKFTDALLRRPNGKIKQVLMDQTVVAGIGNIYSDEMLILASIHPERKVYDISYTELKKLYKAMKKVLKKGIDFGGDSMSDYRNIDGERGEFQNKHLAYRRTGKPCLIKGCTGVIVRKKVGGRSAHFCNTHQVCSKN